MTCRRVCRLLSAYIDGELTGVDQLQVREHLRSCDTCGVEHQTLLSTKRMLAGMASARSSVDLEHRIIERIERERGASAALSGLLSWWALETPAWRRRTSFGVVAAAVTIAAAAAMLSPVPPDSARGSGLAAMARPVQPEPIVPVDDLRLLHESWQASPAAGAPGGATFGQSQSGADYRVEPAVDRHPTTFYLPR